MNPKAYQTQEQSSKCRIEVNAQINETKITMKEMANEVTQIKEEQIKQGEELKYMRVTMSSLDMKMTEFIKSSDTRYASKLAERVVYAMAGMILVSFMGGLITLIIK
jgi:hypothetical protein